MPKLHHGVHAVLIGLAVFVVTAAAVLGGIAYAYRDKVYPGVSVAGVNLSGQDRPAAEAAVAGTVRGYLAHPVKVLLPDLSAAPDATTGEYPSLEVPTTAGELGLSFADAAALDRAWQIGHGSFSSWVRDVIPTFFVGKSEALAFSVDRAKVEEFVHTQVLPKIVVPTPAKVVVDGTAVSLQDPKPGLAIDQDALVARLSQSLETATDNDVTYLRAPTSLVQPEITLAAVKPLAERLDAIGNLKVSLAASGLTTVTPTRAQLLSFFAPVQDDKQAIGLAIQKDAVSQFVQGLKDASKVDQDKTLDAALKALTPLASEELAKAAPSNKLAIAMVAKPKPETPAVTGNPTLGKFEGKYIEVNLAEQRLFTIVGGELVKAYVISSGKWSTPTPTGTFTINGKATRAWSASYGLYMPYWMNFLNNEYGLHELPEWPNGYKEGEAHLGTPVSHGCVRLGIGSAKEVFDWTPNGTPIYIH